MSSIKVAVLSATLIVAIVALLGTVVVVSVKVIGTTTATSSPFDEGPAAVEHRRNNDISGNSGIKSASQQREEFHSSMISSISGDGALSMETMELWFALDDRYQPNENLPNFFIYQNYDYENNNNDIAGAASIVEHNDDYQRRQEFNNPDGSPTAPMNPPSISSPTALTKCLNNWEVLYFGACIPRQDLNPNGSAKQKWINGSKASISLIIALVFAFRAISFFTEYKLDAVLKNKLRNPLTNWLFISCVIGFITYMCCYFSVMVLLACTNNVGVLSAGGLIAYLVLYSIFMGGTIVVTCLAAIHVFDEIFFRLKKSSLVISKKYSISSKIIIGLAAIYAVGYIIYLITVTVMYKSAVQKWKDIEFHMLAGAYWFQILALCTTFGALQFLWVKHNDPVSPNPLALPMLIKLSTWISFAIGLSLIAIANIYWFIITKSPITAMIPAQFAKLLTAQTATIREQDIRSNLNYTNYLLMAFILLFQGWNDLTVFAHIYYLFNTKALENVKTVQHSAASSAASSIRLTTLSYSASAVSARPKHSTLAPVRYTSSYKSGDTTVQDEDTIESNESEVEMKLEKKEFDLTDISNDDGENNNMHDKNDDEREEDDSTIVTTTINDSSAARTMVTSTESNV